MPACAGMTSFPQKWESRSPRTLIGKPLYLLSCPQHRGWTPTVTSCNNVLIPTKFTNSLLFRFVLLSEIGEKFEQSWHPSSRRRRGKSGGSVKQVSLSRIKKESYPYHHHQQRASQRIPSTIPCFFFPLEDLLGRGHRSDK